jgi:hypothetical protein
MLIHDEQREREKELHKEKKKNLLTSYFPACDSQESLIQMLPVQLAP